MVEEREKLYRLELDNRIKEGDHILQIAYTSGEFHTCFIGSSILICMIG
jgi:hypothetical protein